MNKVELIKDLMAAYPHFNPPDPQRTVRVYLDSLKGYQPYELRAAFDYLMENGGRFFPTIPEINQAVRHLQPQPPRINEPLGDFWQNMALLSKRLRGEQVEVSMPESVATEYDELTPEELERLADEKAEAVQA